MCLIGMDGGDSVHVTPEGDLEPREERKALLDKYEYIYNITPGFFKRYRLT